VHDRAVITALTEDGHSVVERSDPSELFALGNVQWHVLVADLGGASEGAAEVLGAGRRWKVPVVLIGDDAVGIDTYGAEGAFAVLNRPFDLDDLRTVVLILVNAYEARIREQAAAGAAT
jgi:hypothetical protein